MFMIKKAAKSFLALVLAGTLFTAITPAAAAENLDSSYDIKVLVIKYFHIDANNQIIDPNIRLDTYWPEKYSYAATRDSIADQVSALKISAEEGSRYRLKQNPAALPALRYTIVDTVNKFEPMPFLTYDQPYNALDYNGIMTANNICDYVNNQGVREVWLLKGIHTAAFDSHRESKMAGPYGDVSNGGNGGLPDMPVCDYSYRVYTHTYDRWDLFSETWGHQIEAEMEHVSRSEQGPNLFKTFNTACDDSATTPCYPMPYELVTLPNEGTFNTFKSEYFANPILEGSSTVGPSVEKIDFNWGLGSPESIPTDKFSARWTGELRPQYSDTYTFKVVADDGAALKITDHNTTVVATVIGKWDDQAVGPIFLDSTHTYTIEMEYYENTDGAMAQLWWNHNHMAIQPKPARCGTVHNGPNARFEYDRYNTAVNTAGSDCEDWNPNPGILGTLSYFGCEKWGCGSNLTPQNNDVNNWSIWHWQNMPGRNNTLTYNAPPYQGKQLRNWWDVHGDFDGVMSCKKTLLFGEPCIAPVNFTNPATNVAKTTATLNGTIDTEGKSATIYGVCKIGSGPYLTFGSQSIAATPYAGAIDVNLSLSGLTGGTTYACHLNVWKSGSGILPSNDVTLTTSTSPTPDVGTATAPTIQTTTVTLTAMVTLYTPSASVYGACSTAPYSSTEFTVSTSGLVTVEIIGLTANTPYSCYVGARGQSPGLPDTADVKGAAVSFKTLAYPPVVGPASAPVPDVQPSSATLSAFVDTTGTAGRAHGQCKTPLTAYAYNGVFPPISADTPPRILNETVNIGLTNLVPNTDYTCRVLAWNDAPGNVVGDPVAFRTPNQLPTVSIGADQSVNEGTTVTLSGSAVDDGPLSYVWTQTAGPAVTLTGDNTATAQFTTPQVNADTVLSFKLTVTDNQNAIVSASTNVTVKNIAPPVVDPARISNVQPSSATLSAFVDTTGTAGRAHGQCKTPLTAYAYNGVFPPISADTPPRILNETVNIGLTNLVPNTDYTCRVLAWNDAAGNVVGDPVAFRTPNQLPTVSAGADQTANEESAVTLSGSAVDDGPLSYVWTQTAGPAVTLTGGNTATAQFTAPQVTVRTVLTFRLTVTDNNGASAYADTSVTINDAPTANAGAAQTVNEGVVVTLTGSGTDPDGGTIASYAWTQTSGPTVTWNTSTSVASPTFTAPQVDADSVLTFSLTVKDNDGATSAPNTTTVTVKDLRPDLIVTAVSRGTVTSVVRGKTFVFTATTKNDQGTAATTVATNTGLYLVHPTTKAVTPLLPSSTTIAAGLAVGSSLVTSTTVTVPITLEAGITYTLHAVADDTRLQAELREDNNSFTGSTAIAGSTIKVTKR